MVHQIISNNPILEDVVLFHKKMNHHNFIFMYRGYISHPVVKNLLSLAERKIDLLQEADIVKRKIFGVMVDCLQTICTHDKKPSGKKESLFMISKSGSGYIIYTGSYMDAKHESGIKEALDHILGLSADSLSALKKEKLVDLKNFEEDFDLDHATIGLINIAKRSGQNLNYQIERTGQEQSFFSLQVSIN
ncbi:MAG: SiaB family protein kinase [Bacteroidetes bacterium]|nr:SiaB family protein kinase [Bacteroidota bacterium]